MNGELALALKTIGEMEENLLEAEARIAEAEAAAVEAAAKCEAAILDRDSWREQYFTASKVIDESLPALADLLAERTALLSELETHDE